jgi:uncharacterized protein
MRVQLILIALAFLSACNQKIDERENNISKETNESYIRGINLWHHQRESDLKKDDSWLALEGLYWLEPGVNTFGSAKNNNLTFPAGKIANVAGKLVLDNDKVRMEFNKGITLQIDGMPLEHDTIIFSPEMAHAPKIQYQSLSWVVIKRGDKYGVRLWDSETEARQKFEGIKRYPVNYNWRIEARLEQNPLPKRIPVTNVLGQISQEPSPGVVVFTIADQQYRLDALEGGEELFIIFADKTNGKDTYGSGRYLYIPKPKADGKTVIDFNKAYNPPCAFTGFATCPLPPKQNFLPIRITAGEKAYEAAH